MNDKQKPILKYVPLGLAALILAVIGIMYRNDVHALAERKGDRPPTIEFSVWPADTAVPLKDVIAKVVMDDDYGLDFTTYRMTIAELDKTVDLPIPGMLGKHYESPIHFDLIAGDPRLKGKHELTVTFSIADDKHHSTTVTKTVKFK